MPLDLTDAVIAQLEANTAVIQAFGDTWNQLAQTGVAKFFTDVSDQVPLPYCMITEPGERYEFMTPVGPEGSVYYTATGQMVFSIKASVRSATRQLGLLICKALNDAPLRWPDENNTMEFRMVQSYFVPMADVGPGVPVTFNRVFVFEYMWSSTL